ncbi:MmgE/PrpD family protein [Sphingobium sp. TCM1]|uniref:MmgE/PrpD family protein n=1 Tax=Sphingobium sp. TCM1 TaxID=453246 RepID=UPI0007F3266F|nr:MmgE/PrpD family protein [Sphingobium sp. TCM1]OAN56207.1 hypothetical protein A7Q26_02010 [Sphingobium sp. TCM1]
MTELTQTLARFAATTSFEALPSPVVREAKRLLLDTIGCAIGAINTPSGSISLAYADALGGKERATVIGLPHRSSVTTAAYSNARLANILDADDTFPTSTHFGNATIFSALALVEDAGKSGADLLKAVAVGFDVGARVGSWMGPPMQIENGEVIGWNELGGPAATMVWAAVGASVSAAGLTPEQTNHAFGIAGANSPQPTLRKWAESPQQPMYKYADAGWCAEVGVSATMLAGMGSTGFLDILDGENAFWRWYGSPGHDDEALLGKVGEEWQILNTTYKPWPCCRWIHHPLTAFADIRRENNLKADEIERVVVRANPFALTRIFRDQHPTDMLSAEFSHAHAMAALAHDVPAGPRWYEDVVLRDPAIMAFREKVVVEPEPTSANIGEWMTGGQWRGVPGGVDVHARGKIFSGTANMSLGDPWSDGTIFSDEDIVRKFHMMLGVDDRADGDTSQLRALADRMVAAVETLEDHADVSALTDTMRELSASLKRG